MFTACLTQKFPLKTESFSFSCVSRLTNQNFKNLRYKLNKYNYSFLTWIPHIDLFFS